MGRKTKRQIITERPNMKLPKYFTLLMVLMSPVLSGYSQAATSPSPAVSQPSAASNLSPPAAEVASLAQSGVGDDVVKAFIAQSHSYYKLSGADIAALKNAGVSSQALTEMMNHDSALRAQEQSSSPPAPPAPIPVTPQAAVAQPGPPPPPQVEILPVAPGPDYLWAPGYRSWYGGAWIWVGGGYYPRGGYYHYPHPGSSVSVGVAIGGRSSTVHARGHFHN
jgi:hypothetical protein